MRLQKVVVVVGSVGCGVLLIGVIFSLMFLAWSGWATRSQPPAHFQTMTIDMKTMTAELSGPIPGRGWPKSQYYTTWTTQGGWGPHSVRSIYHYDGSKNLPYRVRYNAFSENHEKRLIGRSKLQEILSGPYGTVYAETKYAYGKWTASYFEVMLWASTAEHEPAQIVDSIPEPMPPLSAISLVRVLRTQPEFAVMTAVYNSQGALQRTHYYGAGDKNGRWKRETEMEINKEQNALTSMLPAALEKYGLPKQFPIADYLERHQWEWKDTGKPSPENVINLHYNHNRWVRQDSFDEAGKRTTRYLTYVVTPEDKLLEAMDRELPFNTYKKQ